MTRPTRQAARPSPKALVGALALLAALLVLPLAFAPRAEAFVYWTNAVTPPCDEGPCTGPAAIGSANLDGTGVTQRFIDTGTPTTGIAVDAAHIYWTVSSCTNPPPGVCTPGAIGRAKLDGTGVEPSFITTGSWVGGIAVDANHLYWSDQNGIGRAKLDGTGVDPDFITTIQAPGGVAVDAAHIYWAASNSFPPPTGAVGRANLDGTGVEQSFISTAPTGGSTGGIALDHDHLYWTGGTAIARANLDGSQIESGFIASPTLGLVNAVAIDAAHIYWTWGIFQSASGIGRANLNGTVDAGFRIYTDPTRSFGAEGLAVDALTDPDTELAGNATAAKTQKQHGNAIVVKVKLSADERLTAKASGKIKVNPSYKLKPQQAELSGFEAITLKLKPRKAQAKKIAAALRQGESATAKLTVQLTDLAGNSEVEKLRVRLKR